MNLGSANIATLKKCYMDGNEYHLNQQMIPKTDDCYQCLCTENFNNSSSLHENPICLKFNCPYEVGNLHHLRQGCVPIFYKNRCCAFEFKCRKFQ